MNEQIITNEELLHHFTTAHENLLADRLLSMRFTSVTLERSVLDAISQSTSDRANKMLLDVTQTAAYSAEFCKYLMNKVDSEEVPYCSALSLVLQDRQVSVHVLCKHTWFRSIHSPLFNRLALPSELRTIQTQYNAFYEQQQLQQQQFLRRRQ